MKVERETRIFVLYLLKHLQGTVAFLLCIKPAEIRLYAFAWARMRLQKPAYEKKHAHFKLDSCMFKRR
jgi:hypothetical protein